MLASVDQFRCPTARAIQTESSQARHAMEAVLASGAVVRVEAHRAQAERYNKKHTDVAVLRLG
jgi:hypothetical protein